LQLVTDSLRRINQVDLRVLDLVDDLNEEIGAVAFSIVGAKEVVETNKSEAQTFRLVVLETSKNDLHNIAKVWLQRGPMSKSVTRRTF
jgi:hypothetical protein